MAKRYIDTEKARIYVSDFVCEELKKIPSADVVEVKHGEWIDLNVTEWQCSECNYRVERWNNTPYCPKCGAKMDGVKEE